MRKLFICVVAFCVIISTVAYGAGNTILSIPGKVAMVGEEIYVTVNLNTSEKICNGSFKLKYDAKGMELVSCEQGSSFGTIKPTINEYYAGDTVYVGWMRQVPLDTGVMVTLKFRILNSGTYKFEILDTKLLTLDVTKVNSNIEIGDVFVPPQNSLISTEVVIKNFSNEVVHKITDGTYNLQTKVFNTTNQKKKIWLIVAFYNQNGQFIRMEQYKNEIEKQSYISPNVNFEITDKDNNLKVFIWNESNIEPICNSLPLYR